MSKIFSRHAGSDHASQKEEGLVRLATIAEALAGTQQFAAITPATLESRLNALLDGAPEALDTLNEIAAAINDDANFATTIQTTLDSLQNQINSVSGGGATNQIELDNTQAGAGLGANGAYTAHSSSNFIQSATSLHDADDKLDAQIQVNTAAISSLGSGNIANLQTEIDASQAAVGLATNGAYVSRSGTNYIDSASSISGEIGLLDTQIKTNEDAIATKASTSSLTALQSEVDQNQSTIGLQADGTLGTWANTGSYSASATIKEAIEGLDSDLASIGTGSISALQSEIDATQAGAGLNANGSYSAISGANFATSSSSLKAAVGQLDTQAKTNADAISSNDTDIASLQTLANTHETAIGLEANGTLSSFSSNNFIGSSSDLKAAVEALDTQVKTNSDNINGTDVTALQSEVNTMETSIGIGTDGSFSANSSGNFISSASSVRGEINALDTQVNTNASNITSNDSDIASINSSLGNKADTSTTSALQTLANTHESSIGLSTAGAYVGRSGSNYIDSASSIVGEIGLIDAQVKTNETDLSNLTSTVSTLTAGSGATSAEITALQGEVDTTQTGAGLSATGAYTAPGSSNYLGSATSLKDADDKLDAAIKSNEDDIADKASASDVTSLTTRVGNAETAITSNDSDISSLQSDVSANTSAISSNDSDISALQSGKAATSVTTALQSELDATQASLGLNANGTYSAHSGTNYMDGASTSKAARELLDTQLKSTQDDLDTAEATVATHTNQISNLQTELDATQSGAGLAINGAYSANSSSNYLTSASSLKDADDKLDAQIKTNEDDIAAETSARSSAITSVNSSITSLQSELDATQSGAGLGTGGAYTADSSTNYLTSASSLKDADDKLDAQIKTNEDAIASNDSDISTINSTLSTLATSSNLSALQTEVDNTQTAGGLNSNGTYAAHSGSNYMDSASTMKAAREALDTQVKTNEDAIALRATSATVSTLQSEVNAIETGAGLGTDGTYSANSGSNYIASVSSLKAADTALDAQIKTNETAIATKASSSSLSTLQSEVDATQTGAGLASNGTFVAYSGTNYVDSSTTLAGAIEDLDTQLKTTQDEVDAEETARANADNTLTAAINTVEASVGLQANGSLSISGTNFLNSSSTIVAGLSTLDTNQKLLSDIRTNMISSIGLSTTGEKNSYANTNFISNSEDLIEAVEALDRQVNTNASDITSLSGGSISALQTEVDAIETAAGLSSSGTYVAHSGTNFMDSATTMKGAREALDTQMKTNVDNIALKANSTTLSALDLRVTQLELGGGGILLDHASDDAVEMDDSISSFKSHAGPFQINFSTLCRGPYPGITDIIFYGSKAERDGDRHFAIHPTTGDAVFAGKAS